MALPIFLEPKIALTQDATTVQFQTVGSCYSVWYRFKHVSSGAIIEEEQLTPKTVEQKGVYTIYELNFTFNKYPFTFADGISTIAYLSLSVDQAKQNWSASIPVTLLSTAPELQVNLEQNYTNGYYYLLGNLIINNDQLDSYRVTIEDDSDNIVETSAWLKPSALNTFNYTIAAALSTEKTYYATVQYRTASGYIDTELHTMRLAINLISAENLEDQFKITVSVNKEDNQIINKVVTLKGWKISIPSTIVKINFFLERSDSISNYSRWATLQECYLNNQSKSAFVEIQPVAYDKYLDYSIGYKYRLRMIFTAGSYSYTTLLPATEDVFVINDSDIKLENNEGTFLTIRYNPTINSYKYNIKDIITPTIGGIYPIVRRSGNQKYRTFTIGGLISYRDMPEDSGLFITSDQVAHLKGDDWDLEMLKERTFREQVLAFLFADEVKLYRSPTEGQMLVRLSNISLTPNATLGRHIWEFSAQATEIDECSVNALKSYSFSTTPARASITQEADLALMNYNYDSTQTLETDIENDGTSSYVRAELTWFDPSHNG